MTWHRFKLAGSRQFAGAEAAAVAPVTLNLGDLVERIDGGVQAFAVRFRFNGREFWLTIAQADECLEGPVPPLVAFALPALAPPGPPAFALPALAPPGPPGPPAFAPPGPPAFAPLGAAALAAAPPAPPPPFLTVLVWNAQDWKGGIHRTAANLRRGRALTAMLCTHRPDVVVLLESGEAGKKNEFICEYVVAATRAGGPAYTDPVALGLEEMKTEHDKGVVYFHRATLAVVPSVYPIDPKKERRPVLMLTVGGLGLSFLHAIAQGEAAAQQCVELLRALMHKDSGFRLSLFAGDLNHPPRELRAIRGFDIARTGTNTHHGAAPAELDWGYWARAHSGGRVWTATLVARTPPPYACVVWKGDDAKDAESASDHAAILYTLA